MIDFGQGAGREHRPVGDRARDDDRRNVVSLETEVVRRDNRSLEVFDTADRHVVNAVTVVGKVKTTVLLLDKVTPVASLPSIVKSLSLILERSTLLLKVTDMVETW